MKAPDSRGNLPGTYLWGNFNPGSPEIGFYIVKSIGPDARTGCHELLHPQNGVHQACRGHGTPGRHTRRAQNHPCKVFICRASGQQQVANVCHTCVMSVRTNGVKLTVYLLSALASEELSVPRRQADIST